MNVVFRVDASVHIGTGHVIRCLTLAIKLRKFGINSTFFCKDFPGNINELIIHNAFQLTILPSKLSECSAVTTREDVNEYSQWLGTSQLEDASNFVARLKGGEVDVVVVDSYAIGAQWESIVKLVCRQLVVIDDLANRKHCCDILIDQTFGREGADYLNLVPTGTKLMLGSTYALIRDDFSIYRPSSYSRIGRRLKKILISFGGVDKNNATVDVLNIFREHSNHLPANTEFIIVIGSASPNYELVMKALINFPFNFQCFRNINNMAELMCEADLAIGAAGGTSWERCALGLPTLVYILAENQRNISRLLQQQGVCRTLDFKCKGLDLLSELKLLFKEPHHLTVMAQNAYKMVDGGGAEKVVLGILAGAVGENTNTV